jgi:uncharacterized protein
MPAPVTHFEINAKDSKRARDFYGALFGWNINHDPAMNYGMVDTGVKMGINGGISQVMGDNPSNVTFYVQVEDVQAHLDKAVGMGAQVVMPLTEVPNMVTFAMFADFEGNIIGLVKGPQTPPKEAKPKKAAPKKKKKVVRAKKSAKKKKKK